jgi:hypothetical protein
MYTMANLEYITPIYVSVTPTEWLTTPLATISFDATYQVFNIIIDILQIFIQTAGFIMKEGFAEVWTNLTLQKIVYIIGVYNLFMLLVLDNQRKKITEQKNQIENLEKNVDYLKKMERMREDMDELWIQDVRTYHQETSKKTTAMEKRIKKLEKDLKQYE